MRRARAGADLGPGLFPVATPRSALPVLRVQAGVDEAGYGPLLGPLTIGAVALRSQRGPIDPWPALAPLVGRADERDPSRLAVGDSKAVFARNPVGLARLERTALCFHAQVHGLAIDGRTFLRTAPDAVRCRAIEREPWFAALGPLPAADPGDVAGLARELAAALARGGLEVATCAVRAVPAGELNASFARTLSKGATHWEQCAPLFAELWQRYAAEGLDLVVDRHGGRMRYAALLAETFPRATVATVAERPERSEYELADRDGRTARVVFAEKADQGSFAVALASCLAKYARELCMQAFNAHFGALQPGLRPTAGYVTDARRWLSEAGPALERAGERAEGLIRAR